MATAQKPQGIWSRFIDLMQYKGPPLNERFELEETEREQELAETPESPVSTGTSTQVKEGKRRQKKQPMRAADLKAKREQDKQEAKKTPQPEDVLQKHIQPDLEANVNIIKFIFQVPLNKDVIIREFIVPGDPDVKAAAVFIKGIADKDIINGSILEPLMLLPKLGNEGPHRLDLVRKVIARYLPSNQIKELSTFSEAVVEIIAGTTVLFFDGSDTAIMAETKGYEHRNVGDPKTEAVTVGPNIAFIEVLKVNIALFRAYLKSPYLVTEYPQVNNHANTDIAIMYMRDIVNPKLVQEVKRRLLSVRSDFLIDGALEQFIEDNPQSIFPQVMKTERPDRVAGSLLEGRVAILTTGSPLALVVPITLFSLLQTAEDYYVRWPVAVWLRTIRIFAVFLAELLPAIYLAIATFHQEMIPTDLLLAITASRERVPFPTIAEVLLMELSFELIREAGIRVPGVIGTTIGIVGTLVLGQAAVAASIVSPILIIVVATTALASFAIPNIAAANSLRLVRFFYIGMAAAFGFFGIAAGLFLMLCLACHGTSFGVPLMAPLGPRMQPSADALVPATAWSSERRPDELQTQGNKRQPKVSRGWVKPFIKPRDGEEGDNTDGQ